MTEIQYKSALAEVAKKIETSLGLYFPVEKWDLLSRNLASAAQAFGFPNVNHFIEWLQNADLNTQQIEILASYLTVTETFFWREPFVFRALLTTVFPDLVSSAKYTSRTIRIWSAGCSSGEEAYSLAIALQMSISGINGWNISIMASDINPKALQKAKTGIYSPWSFRSCPGWFTEKYFTKNADGNFEIIPKIKNMVSFFTLNLTDEEFHVFEAPSTRFDLIFCRNVLMYFTEKQTEKTLSNFYNLLKKDGWFVVSSCELSTRIFNKFTPVNFPGAVLYRKTDLLPLKPVTTKKTNETTNKTFSGFLKHTLRESSHKSLFSKNSLFDFPDKQPGRIQSAFSPVLKEEAAGIKSPEEIRSLANQGNLYEALSVCNREIATNKLDKNLYFLKASILQEMEQPDEAIASLKQAVYIDPDFLMAHFVLGNLFLRSGQLKNAKRHLNNALNLLESMKDEDVPPESDGLSVNYIREIIQANLSKFNHYNKMN